MIRIKLTDSLKKKIKEQYRSLHKSDFDGEALAYLNRVRGAAKGRSAQKKVRHEKEKKAKAKQKKKSKGKTKKEKKFRLPKELRICGLVLKKDDPGYIIIAGSARNKNQSVAKFVKDNESAICKMLSDYLVFEKKEIDYLRADIKSLPNNKKTFVPTKTFVKSHTRASFLLHMLKKTMIELAAIYPFVFIEYAYDLEGNIHFNCPQPSEYAEMDGEELLDFLDNDYPNITWIRND